MFAQVGELTVAVQKLGHEKVVLEQSMEMEEEGIVNRLQRVIESVLARNKAVEACLEAHGLSVKDINPPPVDVSTEWAYSRSPTRSDAQARLNSGACSASSYRSSYDSVSALVHVSAAFADCYESSKMGKPSCLYQNICIRDGDCKPQSLHCLKGNFACEKSSGWSGLKC